MFWIYKNKNEQLQNLTHSMMTIQKNELKLEVIY